MQFDQKYKIGSVALVQIEEEPIWPALVIHFNKNATYNVLFLTQITTSIVIESMMLQFTPQNIRKAKRNTKLTQSTHHLLVQAIEEAENYNLEMRRSMLDQQEWLALYCQKILHKQNNIVLKSELYLYNEYDELKMLLDRYAALTAQFANSKGKAVFTSEDEHRLLKIVSKQLNVKILIERFILDRLMITIKQAEQFQCKKYNRVLQALKNKVKGIRQFILSPKFNSIDLRPQFKAKTKEKLFINSFSYHK